MYTNTKIAKAVRLAIAFGAVSTLAMNSAVVSAQEDAAAEQQIEKIQITGSRIRSANAVSTSPISTIGELEIEQQQQPEIERIFRNMPASLPGDNSNVNNGTGGAATVNLRGLGSNRNLVLMNGKRMVPYNTAGSVDTSSIPTALIDRIDIVTGGASAVYGSDAISGAINVVLKKNFEGVELDVSHSRTAEADAFVNNMALTLGGNFDDDRGNAVVSFSWLDRDSLLLGQRSLGNYGIATASGANYSNFLGGVAPTPPTDPLCGGSTENVVAPGGGSGTTIPTRVGVVGVPAVGGQFRDDNTLVLGPACSAFNFNPYNYYQTPAKRYSATAMAHYDITDEHTAYGTFNFTNTSVRQQVAPSGIFGSTFWIPMANPFLSSQAQNAILTGANANIGALNGPGLETWRDLNENGVVDSADSLLMSANRRTPELGARSTSFNTDQFQLVLGMEGFISDTWAYDVSIQHGETNRVNSNAGYTNVANIANALNAVSETECQTGGSACVPLNIFGGFGTITPEMAAYASATAFSTTEYQQRVFSAIIDGPFESVVSPLAESSLAMSFGYEYREEIANFNPDECLKLAPASCLGGAGGNSLPVGGSFKVNEIFAEGKLPLVENTTMVDILELEFGYRHANYDTVGEVGSWKLGLAWRPADQLLLRVMKQQATRAPNVGELFAPLTSGLDNANQDPCSVANAGNIDATLQARCISTGMTAAQVGAVDDIVSGQINVLSGSNPNALPDAETADTMTVGFVWTPEFDLVKRAQLSVDYYDIDVNGYIGTNTPQEILDGCYVLGNASQCAQINRIGGGLTISGSGVEAYTTNLSYLQTSGIEVAFNFGFDLDSYGSLDFSGNINKYLEVESLSSPVSEVIDCNGYYGTNCDPQHELRATQRTTWNYEDLSVSVLWRYLGSIEREPAQQAATFEPFREISSYSYFDLYANYFITDGISVSFGVDNLLDKSAPVVGGEAASTAYNTGNTFPAYYDMLGRTYKASLSVKF
ncbi:MULTISPECIES: TonB-dependent receptor domain-containing protein [unclassified Arsukibacterium]|uniref:TonB-dependent receptor domain-containing protein n=1 Tax=unclassified Arsukibacterium TaxID=2635278 RepID=UPI0025C16689|nr:MULTISPECIES: TonB-dependent receptor [unclassified Arsukibacterium]